MFLLLMVTLVIFQSWPVIESWLNHWIIWYKSNCPLRSLPLLTTHERLIKPTLMTISYVYLAAAAPQELLLMCLMLLTLVIRCNQGLAETSRSYLCYAWWRWPRLPRPFLHWLVDLTAEGPRCGTTTAGSRGTGSRCSGVAAGQPRISLAPVMKIFNGWVLCLSSRVMGRLILRLYCSLLWKKELKIE